jgi:hypothetical protein
MTAPAAKSITTRLPSRFPSYQAHDQFTDCVLVDSAARERAHRIVLASQCRWFERAFQECQAGPDGLFAVDVPVNPDNLLHDFVSICYSRRCEITCESVPSFLKMAVFYESEVLTRAFRHFVAQSVTPENVLTYLRRFLRINLVEDALGLTRLISPEFLSLLNPTSAARPPFSLEELYGVASPRVFAAVLGNCRVPLSRLTDDEAVRLTDDFVARKSALSAEDCEVLAGVVSWSEPGSFLHLVKHACDWVPARQSRRLYSEILTNRRQALSNFQNELRSGSPRISRWYALAWLQVLADARKRKVSPTISLVNFVSTLGVLARPVDPCAFGFVNLFYSVQPFAKQFHPANVFVPGKYFMASADGAVNPMIGLDFGPSTRFELESVSIDTRTPPRGDKHAPKPTCDAVLFKAAASVQGCYRPNGHSAVHVKLDEGRAHARVVVLSGRFSVIAVEFPPKNAKGSNLARLASFDAEGHFTNSDRDDRT